MSPLSPSRRDLHFLKRGLYSKDVKLRKAFFSSSSSNSLFNFRLASAATDFICYSPIKKKIQRQKSEIPHTLTKGLLCRKKNFVHNKKWQISIPVETKPHVMLLIMLLLLWGCEKKKRFGHLHLRRAWVALLLLLPPKSCSSAKISSSSNSKHERKTMGENLSAEVDTYPEREMASIGDGFLHFPRLKLTGVGEAK